MKKSKKHTPKWSNINLSARQKYTGAALPKHEIDFYLDDMDKYGNRTDDERIVGYLEIKYPGWNIQGRYEFDCGAYKGEPVIAVIPPDGTYYLTRIGDRYLHVHRAADEWENEDRLKKEAEGEILIENGKLKSFTPHYDIFGIDHLKRIRNCERTRSMC